MFSKERRELEAVLKIREILLYVKDVPRALILAHCAVKEFKGGSSVSPLMMAHSKVIKSYGLRFGFISNFESCKKLSRGFFNLARFEQLGSTPALYFSCFAFHYTPLLVNGELNRDSVSVQL